MILSLFQGPAVFSMEKQINGIQLRFRYSEWPNGFRNKAESACLSLQTGVMWGSVPKHSRTQAFAPSLLLELALLPKSNFWLSQVAFPFLLVPPPKKKIITWLFFSPLAVSGGRTVPMPLMMPKRWCSEQHRMVLRKGAVWLKKQIHSASKRSGTVGDKVVLS